MMQQQCPRPLTACRKNQVARGLALHSARSSTVDRFTNRLELLAMLAALGSVLGTSGCGSPSPAAPAADSTASNEVGTAVEAHPVPARLVVERHAAASTRQTDNPLDAGRAYGYLKQICAIGPRISGTPGMRQQHRILREHFSQLGGRVSFQQTFADNPLGGPKVPIVNMIVQWHPERKQRILICAHCDTRPLADRDPNPIQARQGTFLGANDGASGVAVMMELAHLMPTLDGPFGVDFVLFDAEELVYVDGRDPYFVGSTYFAQQYATHPPSHVYRWGVLLDMVGDRDLQIYQERNSISWRETRPLVAQIWGTAQRLGVSEFIARARHEVLDDHLPLRNIARIPTCDLIDFDYPAWHTTADTPDQCSGESLAKVGWVVYEWLKSQQTSAESGVP
jgi:Peptidase family M28